jgi:T5SS/PEP-CTERM-associated repeat protein
MNQAVAQSNSKDNSILARRRRALCGSVALGLLLAASSIDAAQAADVFKGPGTGNWLDGTQWSTGVAPTTTDDPTLITGGSVTITAGQSAQGGRVDVIGNSSVTISGNGQLTTGFLSTIGLAPTSSIANVPPGTTLPTDGTGTMTIDGAGAAWNAGTPGVRVGNGAKGTLTVSNGDGGTLTMGGGLLSVGQNANGNGTLNIGKGGSVTNTGGALREGYNGATGTVNITNGGTLTTTMTNSVGLSDSGGTAAGTGSVTIDGMGSKWTINSASGTPGLIVGGGTGSKGTITISNGGVLSNDGLAAVGFHAGAASPNAAVGGGTGIVDITGNGSIWNAGTNGGGFVVGYNGGSVGTVTVEKGGTLNTSSLAVIGYDDATGQGGGIGAVTVDGAGSRWNATGAAGADLAIGGSNTPGAASGTTGTLTVSNGGAVVVTQNTAQDEGRALPPVDVPHPSSDDPPPKESLLSSTSTAKRDDAPKTATPEHCADEDHSLGCINQRLGKTVEQVNPSLNLPPLDASSQDIKVGVVNVPGVQQQYGKNFGHSVIPYRPPPPVFRSPLTHR